MNVGDLVEGKYRLVKLIGEGGMGKVFEAVHERIGQRFAIKCLHREFAYSKEITRRFIREAKAAAAIGSEHIVFVTDVGQTADGCLYIVMEHLDGVDLSTILERAGPMNPERAVDLVVQICEALGAVHKKGIVHRDMKPANVVVVQREGSGEWVKVLDFGIAKFRSGMVGNSYLATKPGIAMGTPGYMAPEQCKQAKDVDHRTDIYSTGVILYELLAAHSPFDAETYAGYVIAVQNGSPTPLNSHRSGLPDGLEAVVMRAIARDPSERFQSMSAMVESLRPFCPPERGSGIPVTAIEDDTIPDVDTPKAASPKVLIPPTKLEKRPIPPTKRPRLQPMRTVYRAPERSVTKERSGDGRKTNKPKAIEADPKEVTSQKITPDKESQPPVPTGRFSVTTHAAVDFDDVDVVPSLQPRWRLYAIGGAVFLFASFAVGIAILSTGEHRYQAHEFDNAQTGPVSQSIPVAVSSHNSASDEELHEDAMDARSDAGAQENSDHDYSKNRMVRSKNSAVGPAATRAAQDRRMGPSKANSSQNESHGQGGVLRKVSGGSGEGGGGVADISQLPAAGGGNKASENPSQTAPRRVRGKVGRGACRAWGGTGTLSADACRATVGRNLGGIKACYEHALQDDPSLGGRVSIVFTVGSWGRVTRVTATNNTVSPSVGLCIMRFFHNLVFPPPQGGDITFSYPFFFQAAQ